MKVGNSKNGWILDLPENASINYLQVYLKDLNHDSVICNDMSFHWEIIEAIQIVERIIEYKTMEARVSFNPEYRPGLRNYTGKQYKKLCANFPKISLKLRTRTYKYMFNRARDLFPSIKEMGEYKITENIENIDSLLDEEKFTDRRN